MHERNTPLSAESITVSVESTGPVTRQLSVEVPEQRVGALRNEIVSEFRRHARIPGFRPGKAPLPVVEKNYQGEIRQNLVERLIRETIGEAVEQVEGRVLNVVDIQPDEATDAGFRYVATVEVPPEVAPKGYKKLKLQRPVGEVGDEQVDRVIDDLRERYAAWRDAAEGETAAEGDRVKLTYTAYDGDEPLEDGHVEGYEAQVGAGQLHPKFEDGIIGATAGQDLEFTIEFGEDDAPSDALKNRTVRFVVHVDELKKKELPEADDAFAAQLIPDTDLAGLRARIADDLRAAHQREADAALRDQAVEQLLEKHEVDLPEGAVRQRQESIARDSASRLVQQGYPAEAVKGLLPMMFEDARGRAENEMRAAFVLSAIADAEGIEVSDEDVEAELRQQAEAMGQPAEQILARARSEGHFEDLRSSLRNQRALDLVISEASVKDIPLEKYREQMEKRQQEAAAAQQE
ncbi:MAG: trigger factor [Candidatus Dadabacteria bacterium]|nr:MAG: trigger factor [Candidatus Dadabacteria bacterium]